MNDKHYQCDVEHFCKLLPIFALFSDGFALKISVNYYLYFHYLLTVCKPRLISPLFPYRIVQNISVNYPYTHYFHMM